jgi:hypothetical protein
MTDSPGTLVPAGLAEAKGDQVMHSKLAHVAERHRCPAIDFQIAIFAI